MSEQLRQLVDRLRVAGTIDVDVAPQVGLLAVREAVGRLGWGTMTYACERCKFEWEVWLSLGVEGPPALREHGLYIASPFMLGSCPARPIRPDADENERAQFRHLGACEGHMSHVRFDEDREFEPKLIPDDAPRFVLPHTVWRPDEGADLEIPEPALIRARRFHDELEENAGG